MNTGDRRYTTLEVCLFVIGVIFFIPLCSPAPAADQFSATTLGDHGNVTVMEVAGNYDADNPDGTTNAGPRQAIAREFYRLHKDEYDFLVIFTDFDFTMPDTEAVAFYTGVKNDIKGIGKPLFDNSALYGSKGRLQGTIDMGSISNLVVDPLNAGFEKTLDTISHEMMHRWAAQVQFKDEQGNPSPALLGRGGSHWSFLMSTDASLMYGNTWQDNGNGTFTSIKGRKYYSPLDLYLMGFIDKTQVPPMLLIDNPDIDPKRVSEPDVTITGMPRYITIADIIAAEGERVPASVNAQRTFKAAFILVTAPGTFTGNELYGLENIRNGWLTRYSVLTDGAGLVQVTSLPIETLPWNPGIMQPAVTPRSLPPNLDEGISWLLNNQKSDGSWMDLGQTAERDTAATVVALEPFEKAAPNYIAGLRWLRGVSEGSTDYLSRQLEAMANAGQDLTALLNYLLSTQNMDGGWGSAPGLLSSDSETALVLRAFTKAGYAEQGAISRAIAYLMAHQDADKGWGYDEGSRVETTAKVLTAINAYKGSYQVNDKIAEGGVWLRQHQNDDGGFGNSPSTIYDTALAAMALAELGAAKDSRNNALRFIRSHQSGNGSWNESSYQTALAVEAMYKESIDPDLSVKNMDISFMPSIITNYPSIIDISAAISNLGTTSVPLAKIVLYDGTIMPENKISEQTAFFPGLSIVSMRLPVAVSDAREHTYYIVVDPDNLVKESDRTNNIAFNKLESVINYDFEVLPADLTFSRSQVEISQEVKITARISNRGRYNAYNVHAKYYIDEPGMPFAIGTSTIDIPAGGTVMDEITWKTNKSGIDLPVSVYIDPLDEFDEVTKANNKASALISVNGSTDPNLAVSYKDIIINPSTVNEGSNATISAVIKNTGFSAAYNIVVDFYLGNPGTGGVLLRTKTIQSLGIGEAAAVAIDWNNIATSGTKLLYVKIDPDALIKETTKDDNDAFISMHVLSLPDLAISTNSISFYPAAPRDGDPVSITVMIKNLGEQPAAHVLVRAYDGSNLIGSQTISAIGGNSQQTAVFSYDTAGKSGAHQISLTIDPDHVIPERSKDNNTASKTFGVQNANLWLTEAYISPNGDNVKDSTQVFFRLNAPQHVSVSISTNKGDIVRTFQGHEFVNIANGYVTWDGLDNNGLVVADGPYQLQVTDASDNVLGSLLLVVDNNRSSLSEAVGTQYLTNNNLTCLLPDFSDYYLRPNWKWLPDESGIVFGIEYTNLNAPEYPSGLYTMAPDGADISRIIPQDWTDTNPDIRYSGFQPYLSPDGEKIAFTLWKYENGTGSYTKEMWVVDRDGKNLTFLESVIQGRNHYQNDFYSIKWSPDSKFLSFIVVPDSTNFNLFILNIQTLERLKLASDVWYYDEEESQWSPDSLHLAYQAGYCDQGDGCLWISDTTGNKKAVSTRYGDIYWIGNHKIMSSRPGESWLVDTIDNTDYKLLSIGADFVVSPDKKNIAFVEWDDNTITIKLSDAAGNLSVVYEMPNIPLYYGEGTTPNISNLSWSLDGTKLAFVDKTYKKVDECVYEAALIVLGPAANERRIIKVFDAQYIYGQSSHDQNCVAYDKYGINDVSGIETWLSDKGSLLISDRDGYFVINTETGIPGGYLPMDGGWLLGTSPHGRYINYKNYADQRSSCDGRGLHDIWAIGSLLNLTADLRVVKNSSALILKGIAADMNFEGYVLEYADAKTPGTWTLVAPPSDQMVLDGTFTTWVPPYEGIFYVRLTVRDKAGNVAVDRKRVSWGISASVTNLYRSAGIFSPNNDGVKDTVSLNYTILAPVHLEFNVYDSKGLSLKKFYRNHDAPGADRITWDGTDDSGKIVPDGLYTITVFDFEFYVEVDSLPPDGNVELSGIRQNIYFGNPSMALVAALTGHVYDRNLKSWVIEYGEGDNPQEWTEYIRGSDLLGERDKNGAFITDPIRDVEIKQFINEQISFLSGEQRFRLTVEDFAGNKSSSLSSLMSEKTLLYFHSWGDVTTPNQEYFNVFGPGVYPTLELSGEHILEGINTVGVPLSGANLQYWRDFQWNDAAQASNYMNGRIFIAWDKSPAIGDIAAVRIKAVDIYGYEHYSNIVPVKSAFHIDSCAEPGKEAVNFLAEKLTLLKRQISSSEDARYAQWTDYEVLHAPGIPAGAFSLGPLPALNPGMKYHFRMIGTDENGLEHVGDELQDSCNSSFSLNLEIKYPETADCGLSASGSIYLSAVASSMNGHPGIKLKSLSYYIQEQGSLRLIRTFDLTRELWGPVAIDPSVMPEGLYPVKAVMTFSAPDVPSHREAAADGYLIVDRIQPEARITNPDKALTICPTQKTDSMGKWFSVPIEGIVQDNTGVRLHELSYGLGEKPDTWAPALTRIITKEKGVELVPVTVSRETSSTGAWYVEGMHGTVSLKLKVTDLAGNTTCDTTSFIVKDSIEIALTADRGLFSPNGDGLSDDVTVDYRIDELVTVDIKVFKLIKDSGGEFILAGTPVKTIAQGIQHIDGTGSLVWDGTDDFGGRAADGKYGIAVMVTDACGRKSGQFIPVEVDGTPPVVQIAYPGSSDSLGTIVEIKGVAADSNFVKYVLEAASANSPDVWQTILEGTTQVKNGILGSWNTYDFDGMWILRLRAYDRAGNSAVTVATINRGARRTLIKSLTVQPKLFSPNNDGKLESADIRYEVTGDCTVTIQISNADGSIIRNYIQAVPSAGVYSYVWNGKDDNGSPVVDGMYSIKMVAIPASNLSVSQTEIITVAVDTVMPQIDIKQPVDGSYSSSVSVMVRGTIADASLAQYSISLIGEAGITPVDAANESRSNNTFSILDGLSEGTYMFNIKARDLAENQAEKNIAFTIDRTAPKVSLNFPPDGEIFGNTRNVMNISGVISEKNLESYAVSYGYGENPSAWNALSGGSAVPEVPGLFDWKIGKADNMPDGLYRLSLVAKDKAGLTGETMVRIIIDNTPPVVSFNSAKEGDYIKAPADIRGTASDANLQKYTLALSDGLCISAYTWAPLRVSATSVVDGTLGKLLILPPDGNYCLRLTATDKVDSSSEIKINVTIDTIPPAAPILSGLIENKHDRKLTWTKGMETDIAGYDLYRDGKKLNASLILETQYIVQDIQEGVYLYIVKAIDRAGNESKASNEVKLKIDLTGPEARIRSPQDTARVGGILDIKGTAYSVDDFKEYRIYIGKGAVPDSWSLIRKSPVPVSYGTLTPWDTLGIPEDTRYAIRVDAEDLSGNISTSGITVVVDNAPPVAPALISAVPNLSEVALTWRANNEQDLIGYLLYRNEQIANVQGMVTGNLKPYLMPGTTYVDKALPDGKYRYYLIGMDQAGNLSDQSNVLELTIDTHPPHLTIVTPADKSRFDRMLQVKAESPDTDIAAVQFQYKKAQDVAWLNLGGIFTKPPYVINLDPSLLNLSYGDVNVRAVATDTGGNIDSFPSSITLTYRDITPPGNIQNLKASVNGNAVTLSWSADSDADLDGYNVYRICGSVRTKINPAVLRDVIYHDNSLVDGDYTYEVTASDKTGNETQPSNQVAARIYAPIISQPYSPVANVSVELAGGSAIIGSSVEIFADTGAGSLLQGTVVADEEGRFVFSASLEPGPNKFTAKAADAAGNISRMSDMVAVIFSPRPAAPNGLTALVSNYDAALTWNANTEADLAGYNLYRDGVKLGSTEAVAPVTGSPSVNAYTAGNAFDQDPTTCWMSDYGFYGNNAVSFEIGLSSPELINGLDIQWLDAMHAASAYEVQVWSGYAWITVNSMYNPWLPANHVEITPSYRTDKLRINIARSTDYHYQSSPVGISEIVVTKDNLLTGTAYNDQGLQDGHYTYTLTAVNYYGFESQPSREAKADVGDITPPAAPSDLAAASQGNDVSLSWTANTDVDLAGYNIYRLIPSGWVKLNNSLLMAITYVDAGLPGGTYLYRVTAVDITGNESQASKEASAVVLMPGATGLLKPTIFFPTVSGVPFVLESGKTDISGSASPDSSIALYRDGRKVGETQASGTDAIQTYPMDPNGYGESVSPDGKLIIYTLNDALLLQDLNTGAAKQVSENAYSAGWSPQGNRFAYYTYDSKWNYHIGIYDIQTGAMTPLTDDVGTDEPSLTWAPDGRSIAFSSNRGGAYNLWLKDLASGSLSPLTNGGDVFTLKFSPDGSRLAYFEDNSLYVLNLVKDTTTLVDSQTDYYSVDWSPDGSALAFISYKDGNGDIYTFNTVDQDVRQITHLCLAYIYQPTWTPDGGIVFSFWTGSMYSLGAAPGTGEGQIRIILDNMGTNYFDRIKSGAMVYKAANSLNVLYLRGYFRIRDVVLSAGVNQFAAIASDSSGTPARLSDEITITLNSSLLPDLEITTDNIYLYPLIPIAGQQLGVNLVVWNKGLTRAEDVAVDVYLSDAKGNIGLLKATVISGIDPGSAEVVSIPWDTTGNIGLNSIIGVINPQGNIPEKTNDNNYAARDFFVVANAGLSLTALVQSSQVKANEDLHVDVTLINSGIEKNAVLDVLIEDEQGYQVIVLKSSGVVLPYGYQDRFAFTWNTAKIYAGAYRVHAVLRGSEGILAEKVIPFVVLPDISVVASLVTDKALYAPNDEVAVTCTLENRSLNYVLPKMKAILRLVDDLHTTVFIESRDISSLLPGSMVSFSSVWGTALSPGGSYTAFVEVYLGEKIVSDYSAGFTIEALTLIEGNISTTSPVIISGRQVRADYSLINRGNRAAADIVLKILVMDAETLTIMSSEEKLVGVPIKETISGQTMFSTRGYGLKTYMLILQSIIKGSPRNIAGTSFVVRDGVAPDVSILSPVPGIYYNTQFDLSVVATDDVSGIDSVEYQVDRGPWRVLPVADLSSGRYATSWLPVTADEGTHAISFRATDTAGNQSAPVSSSVTIDMNPPSLTVSTLSSGSWTNNEVLNVAGSVMDSIMIRDLSINGIRIVPDSDGTFSYPLALQDGPNTIVVTARDLAGNEAADSRIVYLDRNTPVITISSPADNMRTRVTPFDLSGNVDEQSAVSVTVNGALMPPVQMNGNIFNVPLALVYGINTIVVTATDMAGNHSAAKRTVTFDDRSPSLAIINPSQDLKTNQQNMIVKGEVNDFTPVTVTVFVDEKILTPAVFEGKFEQIVTYTTEKVYQIRVKAVDEAGNETLALRNVIFDISPPSITIDPVPGLSNLNTLMLTGTMEPGTVVNVTCPTAVVGVLTYPTSSSWTVLVRDLQEGDNVFVVAAADDLGNSGLQARTIIRVDTTPPAAPVIVSPVDGASVLTDTVDIAGEAEPGALVQMVAGSALSTRADLLTGEFVFSQVRLTSGKNVFSFYDTDAAGNVSDQTGYSLTFVAGEQPLTGTIAAKPVTVNQGNDVALLYSIKNAGHNDLDGLLIRVVVTDATAQKIAGIFEITTSVPGFTAKTGLFSLSTKDLIPRTYTVDLQASYSQTMLPETLAHATFEVMPGLEITRTIPDFRNLLVWINDGCGRSSNLTRRSGQPHQHDNASGEADTNLPQCMNEDLLDNMLLKGADSHRLVYGREAFQSELRNPFYTDILILGNRSPLPEPYWEELREKVYSGTGLLASLCLEHGVVSYETPRETPGATPYTASSHLLGITYKGRLSEDEMVIRTVPSPLSETEMIITGGGVAERVGAMDGTTVAGWFEELKCNRRATVMNSSDDEDGRDCEDDERRDQSSALQSPAIVLNHYGRGKTVFYSFDLAASLRNHDHDRGRVYEELSGLILNSLAYVHAPANSGTFSPGLLVPIDLQFRSLGAAFDLKISQSHPQSMKLLDPTVPRWISANPWTTFLRVGPAETRSLRYFALIPDTEGVFTIKADIEALQEGRYVAHTNLVTDLAVEQDLKSTAVTVLALLQRMGPADNPAVSAASKYIRKVQNRVVLTQKDAAENISDILTAIDWLLQSKGDVTAVRLILDELMRGWESRYYFGR